MGAIKKLNPIRNIGSAAGLLYGLLDIFTIWYVPTDPSHTSTVWVARSSVLEGLVGRIEMVGGLWILLVTWGALLAGRFPRALNVLGVGIGLAGILTVVPALAVLGIGFRLGEMVWIVWLGIVWVRGSQSAAARKVRAFFDGRDGLRSAAGRRLSSGVRFCRLSGNV